MVKRDKNLQIEEEKEVCALANRIQDARKSKTVFYFFTADIAKDLLSGFGIFTNSSQNYQGTNQDFR